MRKDIRGLSRDKIQEAIVEGMRGCGSDRERAEAIADQFEQQVVVFVTDYNPDCRVVTISLHPQSVPREFLIRH
ncbi:MAG: hypothetical protein AAB367_04760 [Patescibacteria group bacterium]